jgi:hypothetical protein
MLPFIGPEMVAALLRPSNDSEESMEKVKPSGKPMPTGKEIKSMPETAYLPGGSMRHQPFRSSTETCIPHSQSRSDPKRISS